MKIVIVSGYMNPLHRGHINYLTAAKKLGSKLVLILNNDRQVKLKGSVPFMGIDEREEIVRNLNCVDMVYRSTDKTRSVVESLTHLRDYYKDDELIYAVGGDHTPENTLEETKLCRQLNIKIVYGIGGEKVQSSSELLAKMHSPTELVANTEPKRGESPTLP